VGLSGEWDIPPRQKEKENIEAEKPSLKPKFLATL